MTVTRREVLAQRLHDVHERIEAARIAASRTEDDDQVQLVVVTKTFPASDISLLAELGVTDVGENRDQEGRAKRSGVRSEELRWHMIGRLQRNKVSSVARWADIVESIDRHELIAPLAGAVERFDRKPVQVLLQVSLDPMPDPGRGGIDPNDVESLAESGSRARGSTPGGCHGGGTPPGHRCESTGCLRSVCTRFRRWSERRGRMPGRSRLA